LFNSGGDVDLSLDGSDLVLFSLSNASAGVAEIGSIDIDPDGRGRNIPGGIRMSLVGVDNGRDENGEAVESGLDGLCGGLGGNRRDVRV